MKDQDSTPLTKADSRHLAECPKNKWFSDMDVWPKVKRTDYSLGRLVDRGKLETGYFNGKRLYKVIEP